MDLIERFADFLDEKSLIKEGDRILLAVSGGPDSLTMLDLFHRLSAQRSLSILVFHLNHGFRQSADCDQKFVKKFCQKIGVNVIIKKSDVPAAAKEGGLTPEEAGRRERLKYMKQIIQKRNFDKAALAHNRDDLVETVLFNLFRGTGLRGLKGISSQSEIRGLKIIHPLLFCWREEIEKYCSFRELQPVMDPTNRESDYSRNKIRNRVIPYLEKEINPGLKKVVFNTAEIMEDIDNYLYQKQREVKDRVIAEERTDRVILDLNQLKSLHPVIRYRIIRDSIEKVKGASGDVYYEHYSAVDDLIFNLPTGKKLDLKGNIEVKKQYDSLIIVKESASVYNEKYSFKLNIPGETEVPGDKKIAVKFFKGQDPTRMPDFGSSNICYCDFHTLSLPLVVRNRRRGDRIQLLGMEGRKKIKDFFIDHKIPVPERDLIPLIVDNEGEIIWIAGWRMNERCKVKPDSKTIIKFILSFRGQEI